MDKAINEFIWTRGVESGNRGFGTNRKGSDTEKY